MTPSTGPAVLEKLNMVCAALEKMEKRGRTHDKRNRDKSRSPKRDSSSSSMPDKNFSGCWHCGEKGHSRTRGRGKERRAECPAFAKLLKEDNGLPKDYQGAYERWASKAGKTVSRFQISKVAV